MRKIVPGNLILMTYFHADSPTSPAHFIMPDDVGEPTENPESYPALCGMVLKAQATRWAAVARSAKEVILSDGVPLSINAVIGCEECVRLYEANRLLK